MLSFRVDYEGDQRARDQTKYCEGQQRRSIAHLNKSNEVSQEILEEEELSRSE